MNNKTHHKIICGDASYELTKINTKSIGFAVTSPPYWNIKDYNDHKQIGYNQPYRPYLRSLKEVWGQVHRVLKPGCRFAINIGDQYLRASEHGRYRVKPIPADTIQSCRDLGFDFMGNIIWRKISTTETSGGGTWMGSTYYPKDGHVTYEHEYILLFRKRGDWSKPDDEQDHEKSRLTKQQRSEWFRGYWEIPPERQEGHEAMFPVELPGRLIQMYSFHGETVLDPFLGSGTTTKACMEHGRDSIGIELNEDYLGVVWDRLELPNDSPEVIDTESASGEMVIKDGNEKELVEMEFVGF